MKRLLVVDDDPAICQFVRKVAEPLGFTTETFVDANLFRSALAEGNADAIVLDLAMPQIDGIELLRDLARAGSRAKILIISGFDQTVVKMAGEIGRISGLVMCGVITKPVRAAELRAKLRLLIDQ